MSNCQTCTSKNCSHYHGTSSLYHKDDSTPVIALLGQPNSGKSTIFNMITGSHQHVGNWPGKTVDQKEGAMFLGLKWQAFLAFCASAITKESLLGVLNTLYGTGGNFVSSTFGAKTAGNTADISQILSANFTKAQGLAFIFAISFNMPCVSALAATARETHSVKWTAKIGAFYTAAALVISCIVYHIGLLFF